MSHDIMAPNLASYCSQISQGAIKTQLKEGSGWRTPNVHLLKYDPGQRWTKMNKVVLGQNGQIPNPLESTKSLSKKKTKTRTPLVSPVTWQSGLVNPATRAMSDERTQLLGFPRVEMRSS